jgi:hypothetical protein
MDWRMERVRLSAMTGENTRLPAYEVPDPDADLWYVGAVLTREAIFERMIHANYARRCPICRRVFWLTRDGSRRVDDPASDLPAKSPARPLPANLKYCGEHACSLKGARPGRRLRALGWRCTPAELATALGVAETDLRALIERYEKPDLFHERVSRLCREVLCVFVGPKRLENRTVARLLELGIVCRKLDAAKRDHLPDYLRSRDERAESLTDWVIFVRAYEGRAAEDGDTSDLVAAE